MFKLFILRMVVGAVVILTFIIMLSSLISSNVNASEYEHRLNFGVYTEHVIKDDSEYNEDNEFYQYSLITPGNAVFSASTFKNSHYIRSHSLGAGFNYNISENVESGVELSVIHGYEGELQTHYKGLLFVPVTWFKYKVIKLSVLASVINIGLEFEL